MVVDPAAMMARDPVETTIADAVVEAEAEVEVGEEREEARVAVRADAAAAAWIGTSPTAATDDKLIARAVARNAG